eukprot:GEMP01017642.1.p1 GENE.GEMP01017642.1~~GEMP01017642.1.p1  ORF type:complete len:575 (+),score=104.44 GEMP01017642.1:181-1905(+)
MLATILCFTLFFGTLGAETPGASNPRRPGHLLQTPSQNEFPFYCPLVNITKRNTPGHAYCIADGTCWVRSCLGDCKNASDSRRTLDIDSNECITRTIFDSRFLAADIVGVFLWFILAGVCISAGVGGGSLFTPIGLMLLRYDVATATGLSQASIFGAALGGFILNMFRRHPQASRPLINFELVLFLAPMLLSGALCGVLAQKVLPNWILLPLMVIVFSVSVFVTGKKALVCRRKDLMLLRERASAHTDSCDSAKDREVEPSDSSTAELPACTTNDDPSLRPSPDAFLRTDMSDASVTVILGAQAPNGESNNTDQEEFQVSEEIAKALRHVRGKQHDRTTWLKKNAAFPTKSLCYLALLWIVRMLLLFFQGNAQFESWVGISPCSPGYWLMWAASVLWLLLFSIKMGLRVVSKSVRKLSVNTPTVDGDINWTLKKLAQISATVFSAGVISAMIGIGGGLFIGPVMLHLGVPPVVSAATAATMVLVSSSSVALTYIVSAQVPWSVALTFFLATLLGSLIGKSVIDAWVRKRQLTWVLIAILAGICLVASALTVASGLTQYAARDWEFEGFSAVCTQ